MTVGPNSYRAACPFCGGVPWGVFKNEEGGYRVECHGHGDQECGDWHIECDTYEQAVEAWNKRSRGPNSGQVRDILFPAPVNGTTDDAYYNLLGVLYDLEADPLSDDIDIRTIRRVLDQLRRASNALFATNDRQESK